MIYERESDFAAKLKNYPPRRVYFLYGEQTYLKKLYLKRIVEKAVDGPLADFNLSRFDGSSAGLDEISDAVEALPVMAERKCVVVTGLDVGKLSAAETAKLKELLADPPETAVLVFVSGDAPVDLKKNAKWKAFLKLVDAVGDAVELGTRAQGDTNRFLKAMAERGGCSISSDSCAYLVRRCGSDMQALGNEMAKLCAYRGKGEITREEIDRCVVPQLDASVFDLSRLIHRGDYQGAMRNLADLIALREEPVMILGALSSNFIDLYRARVARQNGKTAADLVKLFSAYKGRDWRVRAAMKDCDRYSRGQLAAILELLARADYRLKSSRVDNVVILQETITRIFALGRG
ncbi:DNA polymerase III subunit delta [Clostridiaceae bacterium NSJ-31]|uniref:DNA polymerase III subunit delta n=3 Tax=Ligaoa zhengdingensis TaxID=2763658 RepID=A0A926E1B1_9FIRM|nr:DNA polymerase III subunit delta [Ligaoa zhengdingensis]